MLYLAFPPVCPIDTDPVNRRAVDKETKKEGAAEKAKPSTKMKREKKKKRKRQICLPVYVVPSVFLPSPYTGEQ